MNELEGFDSQNLPPSIPTNLQASLFSKTTCFNEFPSFTENYPKTIAIRKSIYQKIQCHKCNQHFKRKDHLKRHIESVHQIKGKVEFNCVFCSKKFNRRDNLQTHLKTHRQGVFICNFENCNKEFKSQNSLKYHKLKHGSPKIKCNYPGCKKRFFRMGELKRHKKAKKSHLKLLRGKNENIERSFSEVIHEIFNLKQKLPEKLLNSYKQKTFI